MQKPVQTRELTPPISITSEERQKLSRLAAAYAAVAPDVSEYLSREIERAKLARKPGPSTVHVGSWVTFCDEATRREQTVQLVYPHEADIAQRRVSVMTPIGAALVGMAAGRTITFYTREGAPRNLTVLTVAETDRLAAGGEGRAQALSEGAHRAP